MKVRLVAVAAAMAMVGSMLVVAAPAGAAVPVPGIALSWGDGSYGGLGDGTPVSRSAPGEVAGLTNVVAVSAGQQFSLALLSDGTVWAWGRNDNGQLGDGTITDRSSAVLVAGLSGVTAVSAGTYHSVARRSDGTVWAWGNNAYGQVGDGTVTTRVSPVQVSGLSGVSAVVAGGYHSVARKSDGTVWAWGNNSSGQVGDATTTTRPSPVQVSGLSGVTAVSAGGSHSVARQSNGTVSAWGYNVDGELGDGTTTNRSSPVQVSGLSGVTAVSAGRFHNVARRSDGTVWAWGYNAIGQLGDGTTTTRLSPVPVPGLTRVATVSAGSSHTVVLRSAALRPAAATLSLGPVRCAVSGKAVSGSFGFTNQDPSSPISITSVAASGLSAGAMTFSGLPPLPITLLPGQTLNGTATLTNPACGAQSATITATSDDPWDETATIAVTAYGYQPALSVSPAFLSFGSVGVGTHSVAQYVVVGNTGDGPMTISLLGLQSGNPSSFGITLNNCTATLAAAATCVVEMVFQPDAPGAVTSTLLIVTDNGSAFVPLAGTGVNVADVGLTATWPASVVHGVAATATVTAYDVGPAPATGLTATVAYPSGTTVTVTGTGWTCTKTATLATCTNPFLLAGQSAKLTVKLTFPSAGSAVVTGTLTASGTADLSPSNNSVSTTLTIT